MVKMDERTVVPRVNDAALRRLSAALDREEVVCGFVFGSQASGKVTPLSDIDVAVWLYPSVEPSWPLQSDLMGATYEALRTDQVDFVILNRAPPLLQQRAMKTRRMAIVRDFEERVRLETRALLEYLDTQPLRDLATENVQRRLREGTFGRP